MSYSHQDEKWLRRLQVHFAPLARHRPVEIWADTRLAAGDEWRVEIQRAIQEAAVAVLLVSPEFLASDFIAKDELPPILARADVGQLRVMWLAISHSSYTDTAIVKYQALNDPQKPLKGLKSATVDKILVSACQAIDRATREHPQTPSLQVERRLQRPLRSGAADLFWATVDRYRMNALAEQAEGRIAADKALSASRHLSLPVLKQILDDAPNDGEIQMAVAVALGSWKTVRNQEEIAQMLVQLLRSPFERARYRAAYSIQRYHQAAIFRGSNRSDVSKALARAIGCESSPIIRRRMVETLTELESE